MHPQAKSDESSGNQREHQRGIAECDTASEGHDKRRNDSRSGNKDYVDFGMAEEPEEMLPQQRVASFGRIEEMSADPRQPIRRQHRAREHYRGHRKNDHKRGHHHRPHKERYSIERHARRPHLEGGYDNFYGGNERGDFGERDHLRPNIHAFTRREIGSGERYIAEPSGVGARV